MKPIVVKTYKNEKEYQKDATKMQKKGYAIQNMDQSRKTGCMRWLLVGPFALAWQHREITVTYTLGAAPE